MKQQAEREIQPSLKKESDRETTLERDRETVINKSRRRTHVN